MQQVVLITTYRGYVCPQGVKPPSQLLSSPRIPSPSSGLIRQLFWLGPRYDALERLTSRADNSGPVWTNAPLPLPKFPLQLLFYPWKSNPRLALHQNPCHVHGSNCPCIYLGRKVSVSSPSAFIPGPPSKRQVHSTRGVTLGSCAPCATATPPATRYSQVEKVHHKW